MNKITGTIELRDGTEIEIKAGLLKSKKAAVKYARKIKKRGLWTSPRELPFYPQDFVFPEDIERIDLKYEPITIPEGLVDLPDATQAISS